MLRDDTFHRRNLTAGTRFYSSFLKKEIQRVFIGVRVYAQIRLEDTSIHHDRFKCGHTPSTVEDRTKQLARVLHTRV